MGGRALAVTEILPNTTFYDYEAKYAAGGSKHVMPAQGSGSGGRRGDAISPRWRMRRWAAAA